MFKPSTTRKPVTLDADPLVYHAPQKAKRGEANFIMSRSELEKFAACHRKWIRGIPNETTNALTWGNLLDVVALTPKAVENVFAIAPETYETDGMKCPKCGNVTDAKTCGKCKVERVKVKVQKPWNLNSETCSEMAEKWRKEGKTVISKELLSDAWKANARLMEDEEIRVIFESSDKQVSVAVDWHDPDTGLIIPFKCLLDIVPKPKSEHGDTIYDLKSTASADAKKWAKQVFNDGLFFQGAVYTDAMNAASGLGYKSFGHVISESEEPYEPTNRVLEYEWLVMGRADYKAALAKYCRCLKSGIWPGYDRDLTQMSSWMLRD